MNPEPRTQSHDGGNVNEYQNPWNQRSHEELNKPMAGEPNRQLANHPCNKDGNSGEEET